MVEVSIEELAICHGRVEGMDARDMEALADDFHACQPVVMDAFLVFRPIHADPQISGRLMFIGLVLWDAFRRFPVLRRLKVDDYLFDTLSDRNFALLKYLDGETDRAEFTRIVQRDVDDTTYPSRYLTVKPERDFFGECVGEARKRGMRIVAYYSAILDEITGNEHPDWRVMGRDAAPVKGWALWPNAYCCINNPGYRGLVLGQLAELQDIYGPDGFWLDIFWPVLGENCFCSFCRRKYKEETGGDLLATQGEGWYDSCFVELMREIRALVKGNNPDCVLGQNTGTRIPGVEAYVDFLTHEALAAPTISLLCRSQRTSGKPFEITYRAYTAVISWAMKGPDRMLLEAMTTVAHGGAACVELSPTATGRIMDEPIQRFREIGRTVRELEPYLVGTQPVYDAATFLPDSQLFGWVQEAGWSSVFLERDIPFACLHPDSDLTPHSLLVLDGRVSVDPELARRLSAHVHGGGSLIVEADAARFGTPAGEILSDLLGITCLGKTGYPAHYLSGLDLRLTEELGEDDRIVEGEGLRIATTSAETLAWYRYEFSDRAPGRYILINLHPNHGRSNDPAITLNRFGRGQALFIACPLTTGEIKSHRYNWNDAREYPTQLAANIARLLIADPLLEANTPAGVEMVVNSQGSRHIVHLLNNYVTGQYYDNRRGQLSLADIPVTINEKRIGPIARAYRVLGSGREELAIRRHGIWAEVRVAKLGVHELVVLEH
jgi:hypothetical protein